MIAVQDVIVEHTPQALERAVVLLGRDGTRLRTLAAFRPSEKERMVLPQIVQHVGRPGVLVVEFPCRSNLSSSLLGGLWAVMFDIWFSIKFRSATMSALPGHHVRAIDRAHVHVLPPHWGTSAASTTSFGVRPLILARRSIRDSVSPTTLRSITDATYLGCNYPRPDSDAERNRSVAFHHSAAADAPMVATCRHTAIRQRNDPLATCPNPRRASGRAARSEWCGSNSTHVEKQKIIGVVPSPTMRARI